ncbi:MAG: hypothetical protein MJ237_06090 [bacterium]|nr:hypothetical protein [bacterium]
MASVKQHIPTANEQYGVRVTFIIPLASNKIEEDENPIISDRQRFFNVLETSLHKFINEKGEIVAYYETEMWNDELEYFAERLKITKLPKCKIERNVHLIDFVPNFEKKFDWLNTTGSDTTADADANYWDEKPRRATIYDSVVSINALRYAV